jgi:hypothetical protein
VKSTVKKPNSWLVRTLLGAALVVPVLVTKMSTAGFTRQELASHVEIDGINYGTFDIIEGLSEIPAAGTPQDNSVHKVTFRRDFVTDPSLYLWAKNVMHGRSDLKNVNVVMRDRDGEEVSRYVLRMCQPLSWTVEAANPALGGFHEKIDMAVQEIAVF